MKKGWWGIGRKKSSSLKKRFRKDLVTHSVREDEEVNTLAMRRRFQV